jgi:hypothetical protein
VPQVKQQQAALKAVLSDLGAVEKYVKMEGVSGPEASCLSGEVVRRCVQHLSSVGFVLGVPPARKDQVSCQHVMYM